MFEVSYSTRFRRLRLRPSSVPPVLLGTCFYARARPRSRCVGAAPRGPAVPERGVAAVQQHPVSVERGERSAVTDARVETIAEELEPWRTAVPLRLVAADANGERSEWQRLVLAGGCTRSARASGSCSPPVLDPPPGRARVPLPQTELTSVGTPKWHGFVRPDGGSDGEEDGGGIAHGGSRRQESHICAPAALGSPSLGTRPADGAAGLEM